MGAAVGKEICARVVIVLPGDRCCELRRAAGWALAVSARKAAQVMRIILFIVYLFVL